MTKQININAGQAANGAAGVGPMTSAGNPWTVADGVADDLVNRGVAAYAANPDDITGTAYTLVNADDGRVRRTTNGSAVTITVPPGLQARFGCGVVQAGAGQITFAAGSGVTINNVNAQTKTSGQRAVVALVQEATDVYNLAGSTGA
jgi:hypothetical protein